MGVIGKSVLCGLMGVLGLVGLYFSANAQDGGIYYGGLVVFVVAIIYIFYQLKRGMDQEEAARHAGQDHPPSSERRAA